MTVKIALPALLLCAAAWAQNATFKPAKKQPSEAELNLFIGAYHPQKPDSPCRGLLISYDTVQGAVRIRVFDERENEPIADYPIGDLLWRGSDEGGATLLYRRTNALKKGRLRSDTSVTDTNTGETRSSTVTYALKDGGKALSYRETSGTSCKYDKESETK